MTTMMKPRPTTYCGIQMRSRLEATFAEALDREGICWTYEPECFAGPDGQYLPDFELEVECFKAGSSACGEVAPTTQESYMTGPVYVDVKPHAAGITDDLADRMGRIVATHPNATLLAASPDLNFFPWLDAGMWTGAVTMARCCLCREVASILAFPEYDQPVDERPKRLWSTLLCPYCIQRGAQPGTGHLHSFAFDFKWRR